MNIIDNFLDKITMYRLVLYELIVYLSVAAIFGALGIIHFNPVSIILSALFLTAVCLITNEIFARVFGAPVNIESAYITALILACIISPIHSFHDLPFLGWTGVIAMASKYILAIGKKHIFNPVAIAVVLTSFGLNSSASWWMGDLQMLPVILIGGYLIVRKIEREDLVISFILTTLSIIIGTTLFAGKDLFSILNEAVFHSPLFFFSTVMLTEPLTTPPTKALRILYGMFVGFLFAPEVHIANIYFTPELALVTGNIFSYLVSPKQKLILTLIEKLQLSPDTFDFIFKSNQKLAFTPGQYMEWTFPHKNTDSRGNRRYFTLSSSPTEDTIRLGIKFYKNGSSYKKALISMSQNIPIVAGSLAGDFTLPKDRNKKLVFMAGGIGITPFRSILKYLIDKKEKRDIVVLYSNKNNQDIVYGDVLSEAQNELGIKNICTLTDEINIPQGWKGKVGRIDAKMVEEDVPEYQERTYYLSGPHAMVSAFENTLKNLGIKSGQIKKDFFPGYA